jgi:hypothetical protein
MPHLEYLADVTKKVKEADDIDEADFTEINTKRLSKLKKGIKYREIHHLHP